MSARSAAERSPAVANERQAQPELDVVLPNDIDDPAAPSGGNIYDRRVCRGLADLGWSVHEHAVHGAWPRPEVTERADLARTLAALPDHAVVLLDGLIASAVPEILLPESRRLSMIILMHMPLGNDTEGATVAAASGVIATSAWTRQRLLDLYALPADRVHVATPGVDPAPVAPGSDAGTELLCVAAVTPNKGHDRLAEALATVADLPWTCVCVGPLDRDPGFVERLRQQIEALGLGDRIRLVGSRTGPELDAAYAGADLLVLATRGETYGMVVTEALARGIPVLATAVDGLPEALGRAPDGSLPGLLVDAGAPAALAGALRRWLGEPDLRHRLRAAARARRTTLTGWSVTSEVISDVISRAARGLLAGPA